jgi:1-acyl-sn-glycerol-3-phosphate acyltransferase
MGTGIAFSVFGVGGTLLSFTLFPLIRLGTRDHAVAQRRINRALRASMALFIWFMKQLGLMTYELHGRERLEAPGLLIVANHPTLIDVVFMLSLIPDAGCVVKRALWRNPALRWPVIWAGYIPNSDGPALIEDCARMLRSGRSLLVFPEGTRSVPGRPLELKRGAAQIALASRADILPVSIVCDTPFLTKDSVWYRVPPRRPHYTIRIDAPMPAGRYLPAGLHHATAARHLTARLAGHFTQDIESVLGGAHSAGL